MLSNWKFIFTQMTLVWSRSQTRRLTPKTYLGLWYIQRNNRLRSQVWLDPPPVTVLSHGTQFVITGLPDYYTPWKFCFVFIYFIELYNIFMMVVYKSKPVFHHFFHSDCWLQIILWRFTRSRRCLQSPKIQIQVFIEIDFFYLLSSFIV